jgi:hypothetical protein
MNYETTSSFIPHPFFSGAAAKQKDQKQDRQRYSEQPKQNVTGCACCFRFIPSMHNPSFPFPEGWTGSARQLFKKTSVGSNLGGGVGGAEFPRELARFLFERANREFRTTVAIAEIFAAPLFEPTGALALRDVDEIMQN